MAFFSDNIQQMLIEPGSTSWNWEQIHLFHSLAYRINSLTIGLSLAITSKEYAGTDITSFSARLDYLKNLLEELKNLENQLKSP